MIRDVAAKRYAEAALLIAREDGTEEAWATGLRAMAVAFSDTEGQAFFENSRVPDADKMKLAEQALTGVDPLVLNLARILVRRNRTSLGPQIAEAYQELLDEARGVYHAEVTTAVPLSDPETDAVQQRLAEIMGGQVVVKSEVDEDILGGLVVRIGDKLIDGSTRTRLLDLKRELAGAGR